MHMGHQAGTRMDDQIVGSFVPATWRTSRGVNDQGQKLYRQSRYASFPEEGSSIEGGAVFAGVHPVVDVPLRPPFRHGQSSSESNEDAERRGLSMDKMTPAICIED